MLLPVFPMKNRCVNLEIHFPEQGDGQFVINERFNEFLSFIKKSGKSIAVELVLALERHTVPLADCCGQGHDNSLNMSRKK